MMLRQVWQLRIGIHESCHNEIDDDDDDDDDDDRGSWIE